VKRLLPWITVLLLAAAVRAPSLTAARPYFGYVDEGNYLHVSARMVRDGAWIPDTFLYPSLPIEAVALAARAGGASLRESVVTKPGRYYDLFEPFGLLLIGRVLSFLVGLGAVLLTGLLARRVAGEPAGLVAALLATLVPALATRGGIAMVDSYAVLFVAAGLLFAERTRSSEHPGRESFTAGAMAGLAFASKYPAILVCLPFALTVWLSRPAWRERRRLWSLGAAGAIAAALVAMPGLVVSTGKVLAGLRRQSELYGSLESIPLWKQVFVRAEWDIPFEGPELGWTFVVLAVLGLTIAVRDRRTRVPALGWTLFLTVNLLLYGRQSYQPFRNLLPLVPVACVAVAVLATRVRERLSRPYLVDAATVLLIALLFGIPMARFAQERARFEDSRTETIDWLIRNSRPGQTVLVLDHLAFLPSELRRLKDRRVEVLSWSELQPRIKRRQARLLVLSPIPDLDGHPLISPEWRQITLRRYDIRTRFGEETGTVNEGQWHGNRQTVFVLERKKGRYAPAAGSETGSGGG
jgi:4-amino-4-deoxy-L-arabinose transferase-like glycosyltransferase